jgi:hypothetical protein
MSGCADVCVTHDWDGSNEFYAERVVVARKAHECIECEEQIAPGQMYRRSNGKADGDFFTVPTCLVCVEIAKAFVCGGQVFSMLWESIEEEIFPRWREEGPFECLAKLSTTEARAYIQHRYDAWEADRA